MRRRKPPGGVREELAAEYRRIADMYGSADVRVGIFADRIEAGEPVEVHGYEVGMPGIDRVRVESDGALTTVADRPASPFFSTSEGAR